MRGRMAEIGPGWWNMWIRRGLFGTFEATVFVCFGLAVNRFGKGWMIY